MPILLLQARSLQMNTLLFFIFFGGTTLQLVKCFSDGNFDEMQEICTTMDANHHPDHPQSSAGGESPFTIEPQYCTATDTTTPHTVTLGTKGQPFTGFMLEARDSNDKKPMGVFTLLDNVQSRLQQCSGANSAVTQVDNQPKTEVKVNWTADKDGVYSFVVTFIGSGTSWKRTETVFPPTSTPPPTTVSSTSPTTWTSTTGTATTTTTLTTTTTTSGPTTVTNPTTTHTPSTPTTSTTTSPLPTTHSPNPNRIKLGNISSASINSKDLKLSRNFSSASDNFTVYVYMQVSESVLGQGHVQSAINAILALLLVACFFTTEALHLLVKYRKSECLTSKKVFSILSLMCSVVAFILILVYKKQDWKLSGNFLSESDIYKLLGIISSASDNSKVAAQILTGLAVLFCLIQTILIFLFKGPAHELRRYCCFGFGVIAFLNLSLTAAAIFVVLTFCKYICPWLIIVMAVYLACDVLFFLYHLAVGCKKLENMIEKVAPQESCWRVSFSISTLVNLAFTLALIIGECLCQTCARDLKDWGSEWFIIVTDVLYKEENIC